jgi:hypothetical protein
MRSILIWLISALTQLLFIYIAVRLCHKLIDRFFPATSSSRRHPSVVPTLRHLPPGSGRRCLPEPAEDNR